MYDRSLGSVTAEIEMLLEERLSAKGRTLHEKIKSVGRSLPRGVKSQATFLAEAESRYQHPKFAGQYDAARVIDAYQHCVDYLEKIDLKERRRFRRSAWLAGAVVNLTLVLVAFGFAVSAVNFPH